ncbi:MAG: class I SAM-dependent methyltransferase [Pseudomonadota bacterium]
MSTEAGVIAHYQSDGLESALLGVLRDAGVDMETLTAADLAPVDEFHVGGLEASEALVAEIQRLRPGAVIGSLLDIGCGVGGPARFFAERLGCQVTGIDLTPGFVAAAVGLTERVGLTEQLTFHVGSGLELPFDEASFDCATLLHVGMNIEDKGRLAAEAARVLRPGGLFAIYDLMRTGPGALTYPMPWSSKPDFSFPAPPEDYRQALQAAGLTLLHERDRRDFTLDFFARMRAKAEASGPDPSLAPVMGETFKEKMGNLRAAVTGGLLAPREMIAEKPGG